MPFFVQTETDTWVNLDHVVLLIPVIDKVSGSVLRYVCHTADGTDLGTIPIANMSAAFSALHQEAN